MRGATGRSAAGRSAFTLIELLVVIAIIAILSSLVAAGSFQIIESQRASNTDTAMQAIDRVLQKQWDKVVSDAKKEIIPANILSLCNNDPKLARVVWIKVRLMEAFPMSYAEIQTPTVYNAAYGPLIQGTTPRKYMKTYQGKLNQATLANNKLSTQSAACLLMALSINRGGVALNPDQVSIADTDGDGLPELTDNWDNALAFYRFATGYPQNGSETQNNDLQSANPAQGTRGKTYCDPLDPNGYLTTAGWNWQPTFDQIVHQISPNNAAPTFYVIPVVVSAGRNGRFGLDPTTMAISVPNDEFDNIYSYRLRQGGGS